MCITNNTCFITLKLSDFSPAYNFCKYHKNTKPKKKTAV